MFHRMRILFVSSEVTPFSKTGGLADVAGALPAALARLGHDVTVVTPRYRDVPLSGLERVPASFRLRFPFGEESFELYRSAHAPRHQVLFLEHPGYYGSRGGPYHDDFGDYGDNHRRFAALSVGALNAAQVTGFFPDIVHFNDWQTGLGPLALKRGFRHGPLSFARSVFTVHNLAYQGVFPKRVMDELGLPWECFRADGLEFFDQVSFLKAGLCEADALTTVSPRYAWEIQTPAAGQGLDGLLRQRRDALVGILNGIDTAEWNPLEDGHLAQRFGPQALGGKALCKRALLEEAGLFSEKAEAAPLFGFVGRLAEQKGVDLLLGALPWLLSQGARVVVVGKGEARYEQALLALSRAWPGRMAVRIAFDAGLSHRLEAGVDFFLMPSLFEPCGLNQMYSLRYGAVPLVRAVGGLGDTVVDLASPEGTGIVFEHYLVDALIWAMGRALALYQDPARLEHVRRRGMQQDFSWENSAQRYVELYRRLQAPRASVSPSLLG